MRFFMLQASKGNKLFCLEYERKDYTKKSFEKAIRHVRALNQKIVSKRYDHPKAHRVLFIYHNIATMAAVMDKVKEEVVDIENWFLLQGNG